MYAVQPDYRSGRCLPLCRDNGLKTERMSNVQPQRVCYVMRNYCPLSTGIDYKPKRLRPI